MKSDYIPAPIDVSDIQLPSELCELAEIIAKNVHEVWAAGRLAEGWKYGPERNDALRTHPGLVPYEELSETEKANYRAYRDSMDNAIHGSMEKYKRELSEAENLLNE